MMVLGARGSFQFVRLCDVSEQSALIGEHVDLIDLDRSDDGRALPRCVGVRVGPCRERPA